MIDIIEIGREIHRTAVEHGWWDENRSDLECIALMHSELSEAAEELRLVTPAVYEENGKPEGWLVELVDCFIRIMDFIEHKRVITKFEVVLKQKMEYNKIRPYRHGGKLA